MGKHALKVAGTSQLQTILAMWGLGPTVAKSNLSIFQEAEIQTFRKCLSFKNAT